MPDASLLLSDAFLAVLGKGVVLLLIALYLLFSLIVLLQVRGLNAIIRITTASMVSLLPILFVFHFLLVVSLFFLALVIL